MAYSEKLLLSPQQLSLNEVLTVRSSTNYFTEINYSITDENGRLIRKGAISSQLNEFKLCIVGFKTGVYNLNMGKSMESFTVIS